MAYNKFTMAQFQREYHLNITEQATLEVWKFLHLQGTEATIDTKNYFLHEPDKIVGIVISMLR